MCVSLFCVCFNVFILFARRFGAFYRRARFGRFDSFLYFDVLVDMFDVELDDCDCFMCFVVYYCDVFNKEILFKMKMLCCACLCGCVNEVFSCRIYYVVLWCVNCMFRKLLLLYEEVMVKKNELFVWDCVMGRLGVLKSEL